MLFVFFFFKQKTAYEMRISDWSSDVCSSDLLGDPCGSRRRAERGGLGGAAARGHGIRGGVRDGQRRAARQLSQRWHRFQRHRGLYGASQRPAGKALFHRLQGRRGQQGIQQTAQIEKESGRERECKKRRK